MKRILFFAVLSFFGSRTFAQGAHPWITIINGTKLSVKIMQMQGHNSGAIDCSNGESTPFTIAAATNYGPVSYTVISWATSPVSPFTFDGITPLIFTACSSTSYLIGDVSGSCTLPSSVPFSCGVASGNITWTTGASGDVTVLIH